MPRSPRRLAAGALAALLGASTLGLGLAAPTAQAAPGDVVISENFDDGQVPAGWRAVAGPWSVVDGRLVVSGGQISRMTFGENLTNYRLDADVRFEQVANATRWAGVLVDAPADGAVPWWQAVMRTTSTAANGIEIAQRTPSNGWNVPFTASAPTDAGVGRDVAVSIEVRGTQVRWFFDGAPVLEGRVQRTADGVQGLVADGSTVSFDNVVVTEIEPATLNQGDGELPAIAAHRGYSAVNPENTLAALVAGARAGAAWVETDVHTSADGVPVIMHDDTVDRTTPGSGRVSGLTGPALTGLDAGSWFDAAFAAQRVPTLDEALAVTARSTSDLLLEIKGPETPAEVARILDAVRAAGMADRTLVQSFDEAVLRAARAHDPSIRLGLLRGQLDADPVAVSRDLGVVAYNPSFGALRNRPSLVGELNAAGVAVFAWTADAATDWAWLTDAGVDGIITNRPGALGGWLTAREQAPAPAPAPAPTVTVVAPADGSTVERGERFAVAASTTDATDVTVTLDGAAVTSGSIEASALTLGRHTVTATASGAGGTATASSTFEVVVTAEGLRGRLIAADVSLGQLQQMLTALQKEDWGRLRNAVVRHVADAATRARLLEEIDALAG